MKKIKINVVNESVGLQVFDRYYAYKQSLDRQTYQADIKIEFGPPELDALNIAFASMPLDKFCNLEDYDFVFVENAGETLETVTPYIAELLENKNVYFICGAFLSDNHPLANKVIPYNHNIRFFHDCATRGFYPQYYQRAHQEFTPTKDMLYINGANRSWRKYFIDLLTQYPDLVDIKNSLGNEIRETPDCLFEDQYDQKFREFLKQSYKQGSIDDYRYYSNSINVGIDQKFGEVPPGYFLLDEYYQYQCVIFPESGWINNQQHATEKIYKCFVSGTIPFPISGANIHRIYNSHGYQTAWNLLPKELQKFDNELDHRTRYSQIVQAIHWFKVNSHVFTSDRANNLRQQNQINFYKNTIDMITVQRLDSVLNTSIKYGG